MEDMDREKTVERTTRQLKEIQLALYYKNMLGAYGTDGHHRLMLIAMDAEERGCQLTYEGDHLETPPNWVEIPEPQRR